MSLRKYSIQILATTLLLIAGNATAQTISRDESLKPYTTCEFEDGLKIVQVDRLPKDVTFRKENTSSGEKQISLADGYRVMVAYVKTDFFANIKAEKSDPTKYATDKDTAIEALKWAASTSKEMESQDPIKVSYNGFDGYAINRKSIMGNTLGITLLFSDPNQHIVTIYFLNQSPKKRKFQTIEEWRTLRDNFLNRYTACVKGP